MPKLLQLDTCLGVGSTGRIAEIIGDLARQAGWHTFMGHGSRFIGSSSMMSIQVGNKLDEYRHYFTSRIFDRHGLGSSSATHKFIERIEEIKPDVVHIHNIHGYYANYKLLFQYLSEKGIPTVMTMHDFWLMTGHCAYINQRCSKWEIGCGHCPRLGEYPASTFDRTHQNWELKKGLLGSFDKDKLILVPVSYWLEGYVRQSYLSNFTLFTIPNGVNTNVIQPYQGEHSETWKKIDWTKHTVITVADRWTDANGYDEIIRLSRILPDDIQVVMVGLDGRQLKNLPKRIVGVGHTNNVQQLVELYTSADVLFNPSTEVTFGLVTAEAMACGTPAIVFKNTAGEEIIDEDTGYAIDRLEEIPKRVYECRENAIAFKVKCRNRIVNSFDSIKQYSKYIGLYYRLLR